MMHAVFHMPEEGCHYSPGCHTCHTRHACHTCHIPPRRVKEDKGGKEHEQKQGKHERKRQEC